MWTKNRILVFAKTKSTQMIAVSIVSSGIASYTTYILTKKKLETKYAEISQKEIEEAKDFYKRKNKAEEYSDPSALAEKYNDIPKSDKTIDELKGLLTSSGYSKVEEEEPEQTEVEKIEVKESIKKNIFDSVSPVDEEDDEEFEEGDRSGETPYIITHDEFYEGDFDYTQNSLTYFEEDDVLVDEVDQPIRDVLNVIGGAENIRFGYGSKDKNIVYIRNEELQVDFEVVRSTGSYTEEVLGFIEHSDKPRLRKFRDYD